MNPNFEIEYCKAMEADIARVSELRYNFLASLSDEQTPEIKSAFVNELETYFRKKLKENEIVIWLAKIDGEIVATSTMVVWQAPIGFSGIGKKGKGYILNMYTLDKYRKLGIGTTLLNKLINTAKQMELEQVHLHATKAGINLYKKSGFNLPHYPELVLQLDE